MVNVFVLRLAACSQEAVAGQRWPLWILLPRPQGPSSSADRGAQCKRPYHEWDQQAHNEWWLCTCTVLAMLSSRHGVDFSLFFLCLSSFFAFFRLSALVSSPNQVPNAPWYSAGSSIHNKLEIHSFVGIVNYYHGIIHCIHLNTSRPFDLEFPRFVLNTVFYSNS